MRTRYVVMLVIAIGTASATVRAQSTISSNAMVSANVMVSANEEYPHVEPHVVASRVVAGNLVAVCMTFPVAGQNSQLAVYWSADTGRVWHRAPVSVSGGDPWLETVGDSLLILSALPNYILRSRDWGRTWVREQPMNDADGPLDYTRTKASADGRNVYVWGSQARRGASPPVLLKSADYGRTFSRPAPAVSSTIGHQVGGFVVMPGGTVVASFHELGANGRLLDSPRLWSARSTDLGVTWSLPRLLAENFRADSPEMAVEPTVRPGRLHPRVYLAWTGFPREAGTWGISVVTSDDDGISWSRPRFVHQAPMRDGFYLPHRPAVAVTPAGVMAMTWQEPDTARGPRCFALHVMYSRNGGDTFSAPTRLAERSACSDVAGNGVAIDASSTVARRFGDGGDYHGLVALPDESFVAVWADSRSGVYQLWSARMRPGS